MFPLPLMAISPRGSSSYRPPSLSLVLCETWTAPGTPCDSMRAAVFTLSPHKS